MSEPATTYALIGHDQPEQAFLEAWTSGRLHHAWLLTGARGVGKATFAWRVARFVLSGGAGEGGGLFGGGPESLAVSADHHVARMLEAGSHASLRLLARRVNDRGKLAKEISVDQVRELTPFLGIKPAEGDWRVVIVDAADEMNRSAANALLKMLEEPPARTLFLLISHAPGRLLPTIRSRCRRLAFAPLETADVIAVLRRVKPDLAPEEAEELARLAEGAPGRALRFAGLDIGKLERTLAELRRTGDPSGRLGLALAETLASPAAQPRYEAFLELVQEDLAAQARAAGPQALAPRVELWEKARDLAGAAVPLALDPKAVVHELARIVASGARM